MAGEAKVTKKLIDETASILKAVPEDKIDDVAAKLGVDAELVTESLKNPKSKQAKEFFTTSLKKVGEGLEGMQKFVDQALGRGKEEAAELATKRDIGIGGQPPAVGEKFKIDFLGRPTPGTGKGFTSMPSTGERGGPLVPTTQPGRLDSVASKLQASEVAYDPVTKAPMSSETALVPFGSRIERPVMSPAEIAEAAKQAKPGVAGRGVSEVTPESKTRIAEAGRTEAERAADFELRMQGLPSERAVELGAKAAKAGKYAVGGAAAGAGGLGLGLVGKMLFDKGFSGDETAPPVVKEAGVEDAQDVKTVVDTIPEAAITPEQKEALNKQVDNFTEAVKSFEQRMAAEQDSAKKEKELKEGRLEFMRALETIMHGMVSALGANAMLNRGSPFAIDFSKGPQTDWASEFDRLQKNYDSQLNGIRSRYGLALKEQEAKAAEARAQQREARAEKELALKEKALEQRGVAAQEKQAQRAAGQAEKAAEKQLALQEKAFAELSGSIAALKEKSTPISAKQVTANATRLGIPPEEIKLLIDKTTGKGFFNFADENKVAEILEKYRPGQAAAEAAPVESEQERKERRRQELLRKARGE